ncbi:MAG: helix-turn-helix domain-containing protein [Clostridiales bacterium]|nr:helix-turn-helix domain-containing protein [Clostridiales bacterium]
MELNSKLRSLRTAKGITQEQLAAEIGVSAQAVSKWERGATLPDISLLPDISVFFGVSIDELFGITEEKEYERIQNMIWDERLFTPDEISRTERWIDAKVAAGYRPADCLRLKADMYNHLARTYNDMAAEAAMEALAADPACYGAHAELNEGLRGFVPDWNVRNHYRLIAFYKDFVKKNPKDWRAHMWLLDNLLDDKRFKEAEEALKGLEKADNTFRTPLYRAKLLWETGRRDEARKVFAEMEKDFGNEWMVMFEMGELCVLEGDYEGAIEYIKKARERQEKPRFADTYEALAQLYEITGDYDSAIEALEGELRLFKEDWGFDKGETADQVRRGIARLKKLK